MNNLVTKNQHIAFRLKHAEQLLREYNQITCNLNPKFAIPENGGKMMELISLSERTQQFIN